MPLIVEQCDALGEAALAQRRGELEAGVPRADDDDRTRRHRNNPDTSEQE
ncbi:hypothetical protein MTX20_21645 [Bradyrhizobium sp. ISRA435]|nr:hypothetical protein MTX20_21645 [Bradyrhizobium sp. ISRA435]